MNLKQILKNIWNICLTQLELATLYHFWASCASQANILYQFPLSQCILEKALEVAKELARQDKLKTQNDDLHTKKINLVMGLSLRPGSIQSPKNSQTFLRTMSCLC